MNPQLKQKKHIVGIHFAVGPKIGEGSFGVIFEGENILNDSDNQPVAIKFEPRRSDAPQLRDEFRAYRILNGCEGIPHAYYFGQEGMHNVLIIDLLGPSLEDLFEWCGRKFSVKTTCLVAKQMISRVRTIHEHDLIYRDIKPDNFLISQYQRVKSDGESEKRIASSANNDPNLIYTVDFGMAKQYRDPRTKQHIPYRERKSLSGTARYMSINTHFGREQSRRDDLESLGHVFFYFLKGSLPWQGLKAPNNKLKYEKIGLTKQKLKPEDLLSNNIPVQFATYLKYVRNLKFDEDPDFDYLLSLMDEVLKGYSPEEHYDWMDLNDGCGWDIHINKRANLHGYGNPTPRATNRTNNSHTNNNTNIRIAESSNNVTQSANVTNKENTFNKGYSNIKAISQQNHDLQQQKFTMSTKTKQYNNLTPISLPNTISIGSKKQLMKHSNRNYPNNDLDSGNTKLNVNSNNNHGQYHSINNNSGPGSSSQQYLLDNDSTYNQSSGNTCWSYIFCGYC
ncbi:hypothetical protein TPHA_0D01000 [Tetrapisispora phaffii CBS 4417]|uniref:non-specific serine/threonine protein kinase n=1 Tax=Tetrapisispora phaffii (strain ATCC 24235 / CBS 4417 / NBRC 1672 / NRRL Y-8282 / UCD 70-5) TaxID=1071381 RepID=G8BSC0_TETPH|nr:hypothetical protein TPHA_0D01000 [Tetrapisispora phaffii CBS 4417]CCE62741.1 hypothetical protein TPHA_0D01000 [Tetrapisispora phaffii CBS 4417]